MPEIVIHNNVHVFTRDTVICVPVIPPKKLELHVNVSNIFRGYQFIFHPPIKNKY